MLDVSRAALDQARRRVGDAAPVDWLCQDLIDWQPERRFDLWHDRALFHFFVTPAARRAYLRRLHSALQTDGSVVLATFAPDGPEFCSGLPVARYSAGKLAQQIGAGFELIQTRREEHTDPNRRDAAVYLDCRPDAASHRTTGTSSIAAAAMPDRKGA